MNPDEVMEKARQLRAAGVPVAEIEKYIQSKLGQQPEDDTVEVNASYPERLATTILQGAQVVPGMKSFQAAMGSLGSKFTDHPVSYADAKAGLEEQTDRMGGGRKFLAEAVSSPMMAPVMAARGVAALSPMMQGAAYGAAKEGLDYNPDEALESRILRTGIGGVAGGALTGTASGIVKLVKAPPGTAAKAASKLFPKTAKAIEVYRAASEVPPVVKPKVRLNEASAPKAEGLTTKAIESLREIPDAQVIPIRRPGRGIPIRTSSAHTVEEAAPTLEGLLGNAESVSEAGKHVTPRTLEDALGLTPESLGLTAEGAPAAALSPGTGKPYTPKWRGRGATKARDEMWAEKIAGWKADPSTAPGYTGPAAELGGTEPTLEELLALSNEHLLKGGKISELLRVNPGRARQ